MNDGEVKYGVFSAVGKQSLHRNWLSPAKDFDLHLIVYDQSIKKFQYDTPFIKTEKGYKFKLIYSYFSENPHFLDKYNYYYMPDDDILIDSTNITKLFNYMKKYSLQIAQPALYDSYYTFSHTVGEKYNLLRYTNFVEIMQPCFSREALKKVLFTFNENESGWGIDYHWAKLIGLKGHEMAIIDDVKSVHSRPVSSYNQLNICELNNYLTKHKLNREIKVLDFIPKSPNVNSAAWEPVLSIESRRKAEFYLEGLAQNFIADIDKIESIGLCEGRLGLSFFFFEFYRHSERRKYLDMAHLILEMSLNNISSLRNNDSFQDGLPGLIWFIEHLAQRGYIENNTNTILQELLIELDSQSIRGLSMQQKQNDIVGQGIQLLKRYNNQRLKNSRSEKKKIASRLSDIIDHFGIIDTDHLSIDLIIGVINLLNQLIYAGLYKDECIKTLPKYVKIIATTLQCNNESCLINFNHQDIKSIIAIYTSSITTGNEQWKHMAIEISSIISNTYFTEKTGNSHSCIESAALFSFLYQQSKLSAYKSISATLFDQALSQFQNMGHLIQEKTERCTASSNEVLPSMIGTGLMIISLLMDCEPEWSFFYTNSYHYKV